MFKPQSKFQISAKVFDLDVLVSIEVSANEAFVLPLPSDETPTVVDVQNLQTLLVSHVNLGLRELERMVFSGEGIDGIRSGKSIASPPPTIVPPSSGPKIVDIAQYRESIKDAEDGKGN